MKILSALVFCLLCVSCRNFVKTPTDISVSDAICVKVKDITAYGYMKKIEFDGHRYILFADRNGRAMSHDPDCVCKFKYK